jgi:hypothetical protein
MSCCDRLRPCVDAQRLWDKVADAHKAYVKVTAGRDPLGMTSSGRGHAAVPVKAAALARERFDAAMADYDAHFKLDAVQGTLT